MKTRIRLLGLAMIALASRAEAGPWQAVDNPLGLYPYAPLLLTDGTVMMNTGRDWYRLSPNLTGSYVHGTWSRLANPWGGLAPLYYASAVLPDGRVIISGGEYNYSNIIRMARSAIYDPLTDKWKAIPPPRGSSQPGDTPWTSIGDAPGIVLATGQFMLGNCCTSQDALLDPKTLTWTSTGDLTSLYTNEEGWTLLPDGSVLTANAWNPPQSQRYVDGKWISAGSTIVNLTAGAEIGPQLLRPDGSVIAFGASGHNAVYKAGKWSAVADFPKVSGIGQLTMADAPAALLPNGDVLVAAGPGQNSPTRFYEWNGTKFTLVAGTPNASSLPPYAYNLVILPTGQILETGDGVEVYTSTSKPDPAWAPQITSITGVAAGGALGRGTTYQINGVLFNGMSAGAAYGDDYQTATNYPILRVTNTATGHVFYGRTFGHSSMAVASTLPVSTHFTLAVTVETGASTLEVVANGIASQPLAVTVK
jgi:hypothetical protein